MSPSSGTRRVIARLDVKGPNVVRGIQLEGLRIVGRPENMAQDYAAQGIDEIFFIDTVATLYGRNNMLDVVERTAEHVFIPLTVGGGIRTAEDVGAALRAGADKVTVSSAAVREPALISRLATEFGSQCIVVAMECKRLPSGEWTVLIENGREPTGLDAFTWAGQCAALGAGEILLTSIDRDGMRCGFDLELVDGVANCVSVPVIASGGPGTMGHVAEGFIQGNADAVALGTLLHFGLCRVSEVKAGLAEAGIPVRQAIDAKAC